MYCRRDRAPRRHPPAPLAGRPALLPGAAHGPPAPSPRRPRLAAGAGGRRARAVRPARARPGRPRHAGRGGRAAARPDRAVEPARHRVAARDEAEALLDDFHAGVLELGAPFELWAGLVLADPSPARVDALLDAGAVGLSLPAGALGGPAGIERLGPALERLAQRGAPLFVHPGPAAGDARLVSGADRPTWPRCRPRGTRGRSGGGRRIRRCASSSRCSPGSRRCTPSGSPPAAARATRCTTRSRSSTPRPTVRKAIDAMLRVVGVDRLLYGSDRPVIEPVALARARRRGRARHRRHQPGALRMSELDGSALESLVRDLAADPERLGAPRAPLPRPAPLRGAAPRRRRRGLADLLDGRPRHGLPRPRPVRRRGGGGRRARSPRTGWRSAARRSTRTFESGEAFHFSAADIHRVRHTGTAPAVTIHAYSPPLWRMGAYEILPGGELRRHSLSYAEELRPLEST